MNTAAHTLESFSIGASLLVKLVCADCTGGPVIEQAVMDELPKMHDELHREQRGHKKRQSRSSAFLVTA
jgi:hypothetical protein